MNLFETIKKRFAYYPNNSLQETMPMCCIMFERIIDECKSGDLILMDALR